jgi:hypothetical protein
MDQSLDRSASADGHDFRVTVGAADCRKPYALSLFNVSAMSFGALSFAEVYTFLEHRGLLSGSAHSNYSQQWELADAQGFAPFQQVRSAA